MKQPILLFFIIILGTNTMFGQHFSSKKTSHKTPFVLGTINKIQSVELGEMRTLNIYLPEGYSPDSAITYPVIYLLDGSANEDFVHITGVVQFLTMIAAMPASIIVGIANVDRKRDFTFATSIEQDKKDYPTTGSSAKFMAFIEKELQPFIQKKYKTNTITTIIGQSLGGLFATEVLLKNPGLFNNYIIVSPSLWWDNESLLATAPTWLKTPANHNIQACILVGSEGKKMEGDAKQLAEILNASGKTNWHTDFIPLSDENHLTILHNAVYKALQALHINKAEQKK